MIQYLICENYETEKSYRAEFDVEENLDIKSTNRIFAIHAVVTS